MGQDAQTGVLVLDLPQNLEALQCRFQAIRDPSGRNHTPQTEGFQAYDGHIGRRCLPPQPLRKGRGISRFVHPVQNFQCRRAHLQPRYPRQLVGQLEGYGSGIGRQQ